MLAHLALPHELLHGLLEATPGEMFLDTLICGCRARVAPHRAGVEGGDELGLHGRIGANPELVVEADDALTELIPLLIRTAEGQSLEKILGICICLVGIGHFL